MDPGLRSLVAHVLRHRCLSHPVFRHWARVAPSADAVGALFHQIQCFCAATRPGGRLPEALRAHGLADEGMLLQEIVDSEANHGPELATMAGHILNRAAGRTLCPDLYDQAGVEAVLRSCSDRMLGALPGYDPTSGLTVQARSARAVFDRRWRIDHQSTLENLGTTLALELVSHRHLIPGEVHCLVESGLYGTTLDQPEMRYLLVHSGDAGAERRHESHATSAVSAALGPATHAAIRRGADDFLDALANLWDVLDAALLRSGIALAPAA
jgi:hypothetical protein